MPRNPVPRTSRGLSGKDLESSEQLRNQHVSDEVFFWRRFCETRALEWADRFHTRLDPNLELQPSLRELLRSPPVSGSVSILDVGAGPMTYVGRRWPGKRLRIVAVDPLAREYEEMLNATGLSVPVPTIYGRAEDLESQFRPGEFDLVHARNCLDHSINPLQAIHAMSAVCKPGCYLYL